MLGIIWISGAFHVSGQRRKGEEEEEEGGGCRQGTGRPSWQSRLVLHCGLSGFSFSSFVVHFFLSFSLSFQWVPLFSSCIIFIQQHTRRWGRNKENFYVHKTLIWTSFSVSSFHHRFAISSCVSLGTHSPVWAICVRKSAGPNFRPERERGSQSGAIILFSQDQSRIHLGHDVLLGKKKKI